MLLPSRAVATLRQQRTLTALCLLQGYAGLVFALAMLSDLAEGDVPGTGAELAAVLVLWAGSVLGVIEIRRILACNRRMARTLRIADGGLADLLEERFARWQLTPSERDVALLAVKGLSVAEIAGIRRSRHGTVKAQLAAVYRKSGVSGQSELIGRVLVDLALPDVADSLRRTPGTPRQSPG
jgi:DNA-binding CsgD family transcriptional regulator